MPTTKTIQDNKQDNPVRWYQVPVLWLCIAIFLLTLAACAHLIMVSLEANKNHSASANNNFKHIEIAQKISTGSHVYRRHETAKPDKALR